MKPIKIGDLVQATIQRDKRTEPLYLKGRVKEIIPANFGPTYVLTDVTGKDFRTRNVKKV